MSAPTPAGALHASPIVGRDACLSTLTGLVSGGEAPGIVALVGEAGIGKSRLARWAADAARERGRTVIVGNATQGLAEPLGLLRDAVRAARRAGLEPVVRGDRAAEGLPALLLPELGAAPDAPEGLGATFDAGRHATWRRWPGGRGCWSCSRTCTGQMPPA